MPGKTDRPGADHDARARPDARAGPGRPAEGGRPPGSQDELRRRLANLPPSHPSSPRYRAGPRDVAGGAAAAAARAARGGRARSPEQEARDRRADDALWARAAAQHAAAQARRRARGAGVPSYPPAKREPFRPWFAASAEGELWLNAGGT